MKGAVEWSVHGKNHRCAGRTATLKRAGLKTGMELRSHAALLWAGLAPYGLCGAAIVHI
jgi:hypothetical protein